MHGLSKSRFVRGHQCHEYLWWSVHEPDAPELRADDSVLARFRTGHRVTEAARERFPGGVLVDRDVLGMAGCLDETARLLALPASEVPAIFEAAFRADGVYVAVDILERSPTDATRWRLIEVKSTLDVKDEHLPDVAVQAHVLRASGVVLDDAELMHLNRECRFPDLSNLFVRESLLQRIAVLEAEMPDLIAEQLAMLAGPRPEIEIGPHCSTPYECPFIPRCWPARPEHHVSELHRGSASLRARLADLGHELIADIPDDVELSVIARRQADAVRSGRVIIEPGLGDALAPLTGTLAFYDFETIMPALPCWPGQRPYQQVPLQFSVHLVGDDGSVTHVDWLADGPGDPRAEFAERLLDATRDADVALAYNASFERSRLEELALAVPSLADELRALSARTQDLLPIVRQNVYHPEFHGSFSLKAVTPALLPALAYDDLEVASGGDASSVLEGLLLEGTAMTEDERARVRGALRAYCERDTRVLVELLGWLRGRVPGATRTTLGGPQAPSHGGVPGDRDPPTRGCRRDRGRDRSASLARGEERPRRW